MTNDKRPALVVFQGGVSASASPLEHLVVEAQSAATLDLLSRASASGAFSRLFLIAEDVHPGNALPAEQASSGDAPLITLRRTELGFGHEQPFHFGRTLQAVCKTYGIERAVYAGGGAMPLGTEKDLADLALAVSGDGECVVA